MWGLGDLSREAWRNLGARQVGWGMIAALLCAVMAALLGLVGIRSLEAERQLRLAGSLVWAVQPAAETTLSGLACDRLRRSVGVDASGGLVAELPPTLSSFRGGYPLSVFYVTPGTATVFDVDAGPGRVLVGSDLADTLQVGPGSWLVDQTGTPVAQVEGRLRAGVPVAELASGVIIPTRPDLAVRVCWVRFDPGSVDQADALLRGVFAGSDVTIGPVVGTAQTLTPLANWLGVAGLMPWLVSAVVVGLIGALVSWSRRSEFAVYRAFGTSRAACLTMVGLEYAILIVPVVTFATMLAITICTLAGTPPGWTVTWLIARSVVSAVLGGVAVLVVASYPLTAGNIAAQLKDR